ncbi:MAG TPA: TadE/TadG family type IV pilus assembly protein [Caulobacteraceae bacterium]|jgi:Flp pilus assembly protein TadG
MPATFRRVRPALRRFAKARGGATAVEFALIATPFFLLMMGVIELSLAFLLSTSLENATSEAARKIRTGEMQTKGGATATTFRNDVCASLGWLAADCPAKLAVDVRTFQTFASVNMPSPVSNGTFNPGALMFQAGGPNDIVVVRAYYRWSLFTPLVGQAMEQMNDGSMLVVSTATFRNEPYGS